MTRKEKEEEMTRRKKQCLERVKGNLKRDMKILEMKEQWSNMDFDLYESKELEIYAIDQYIKTIGKEDE